VELIGLLAMLLMVVLVATIVVRILQKAGFSPWCGLLLLIPLIGFIGLVAFAFIEWPVQRELAWLRLKTGTFSPDLIPSVERYALKLEKQGEWKQAAEVYELLAHIPSVDDNAEYYRNCVKRLKEHLDL
jgi:hypothetical protein